VPAALHTNILSPTPQNTVRCGPKTCTETKYIKVKVKSTPEDARKAHSDSRSIAALVLTEALEGVGGLCQDSATAPPEMSGYPLYRRLVGPKGGLGGCRKSRSTDRPARSESLYRLRYRGLSNEIYTVSNCSTGGRQTK